VAKLQDKKASYPNVSLLILYLFLVTILAVSQILKWDCLRSWIQYSRI